MITPQYCAMMARYNQWQNNSLREHVDAMDEDELRADRGAFFGSILATLDHIVWADRLWLNRHDASISVPEGVDDVTVEGWRLARPAVDQQIIDWADGLSEADMTGDVVWTSVILAKTFTNDRAMAIAHMFNHQTHHRGQIHAMLTAMGRTTMDTDIVFMPET